MSDDFVSGNELMKVESYSEAVAKYTSAIEHDPRNAVYYSNRYVSLNIYNCEYVANSISPRVIKV